MRTAKRPTRDLPRRLARSERGSALVEFAVASMVFFMVTFGTIEFSMAVWRYNMVSDLAQEGARYASVHGFKATVPANEAAVQTYVRGRVTGLMDPLTFTVTTPDGAPSVLNFGETVSVRVTSSYTPLSGLVPAGPYTLTNTAQMIMAR